MHFDIITLFPEMFPGTLGGGIIGRALKEGAWSYNAINPRDFTDDAHRTVDDAAFGGTDGQVMMAEPLARALDSIQFCHCEGEARGNPVNNDARSATKFKPKIIYFSPRGKLWNQQAAREFLIHNSKFITLICGRYEGIDQRLLDEYEIEEISVGDYILSGGEIAAQVFIDSIVRLCNNVIRGGSAATENESFEIGGLEWPLYTRPHEWRGRNVPEVLVSGHHENILRWRKVQSEKITLERRPDLIKDEKK